MSGGWTLDHDTPAGKLMTVFRCGVVGGRRAAVGRRGGLQRFARPDCHAETLHVWYGRAAQHIVISLGHAQLLLHTFAPPCSCSAPDYPQFMPDDTERYNNLAAVAVLTGPGWATPDMQQYAAAHPRCVGYT